MAGQTIKEFLVGLGVTVKREDVQNFMTTIDSMGKAAGKLVLGLQAAAAAIKAAILATAAAMEQLYYVAQRGGTTVETLKELQYGFRQVGLSAQDANGAVEALAMAMRVNPGNEALLRHLGVATRDLKGNMRDTVAIEDDLLERLRKMPFYIAAQYAEMFGISARTLYQLLQNMDQVKLREKEWADMARRIGVDLNRAGVSSKDFMQEARGLGEVIELMWIRISTVLEERLTPQLRSLKEWLIANGKEITDYFIAAGNKILDWADQLDKFILDHGKDMLQVMHDLGAGVRDIGAAFNDLFPLLTQLTGKTNEWKIVFGAIADIILYRMFGPLGLVYGLLSQLITLLEAHGITGDNLKPKGGMYDNIPSTPDWLDKFFGLFGGHGPSSGGGFTSPWSGKTLPGPTQKQSGQGGDRPYVPANFETEGDGTRPAKRNNPGNLRRWATAIGSEGGFAVFRNAAEGLAAMRDNLVDYVGKGYDTIAKIVTRWAPPSENNTAAYIANIAKSLGIDPNAKVDLNNKQLFAGLLEKMTRIEQGFNPYSHKTYENAVGAGATPLGAGNITNNSSADKQIHVQQHNDIKVEGGSAPHDTGRHVGRAMDQMNAALVRDFRTAVLA